ncbi:mfs monocarboxylate transporter [Malassezia pachydermatis]|uniref:Mfs monocarboxylate transporter n=1 Tax=Malassezia pachydermatis TaxID=77020 RepID=A0A0M8MRP4_9BASI|nr:mfs monocarboxylate transporter [Malassezia pachydermatis]KOS12974.1 mfs monocarboxylate transporter [Malassezia pachydermatis]
MFALAIVTTGTSTGGMIFPAIAERLLNTTGFGWMIRVMGFVMLFNAIIILLLLRPRVPPRKGGPFVEWKAFLDPVYTLYVAGAFFCIWGNFVVYFYNRSFARNILHTSSDTSFELLLVMNAIGYPGRIIPAIIADRYLGPVNTLIPAALLSGIVMGTWMAVDKLQGEWAFTIVYGFFSSGVMGLVPSALSSLTDDLSKLGIRMGLAERRAR